MNVGVAKGNNWLAIFRSSSWAWSRRVILNLNSSTTSEIRGMARRRSKENTGTIILWNCITLTLGVVFARDCQIWNSSDFFSKNQTILDFFLISLDSRESMLAWLWYIVLGLLDKHVPVGPWIKSRKIAEKYLYFSLTVATWFNPTEWKIRLSAEGTKWHSASSNVNFRG